MAVGGGTITTLTTTSDITVQGVTVGRGAGAVSTNTAVGASALSTNSTGGLTTAVGFEAAKVSTAGDLDAFGYQSLKSNTTGTANSAFGTIALSANTTGIANVAAGRAALNVNTTGSYNTAVGRSALEANTISYRNTAIGYQALYAYNRTSTVDGNMTAVGFSAGAAMTTGQSSTFVGCYAGQSTTGTGNTFVGQYAAGAQTSGDYNSYFGSDSGSAMTTGAKNSILGRYSGNQGGLDIRTADNYIVLSDGDGNPRARWDNNGQGFTVGGGNGSYAYQILNGGNSNPYGLYMQFTGASPNNTSQYFLACADSTTERFRIYSNGTYGSVSDARLKKNIETSRGYLSDLCQLRVVKYGWATSDDSSPKELGLIAQEVEQVFPTLVDNSGEYKMIKQPVLIPMLVKAIQELKAEVDSLKAQLNGASA
jgi:hypothetical protein